MLDRNYHQCHSMNRPEELAEGVEEPPLLGQHDTQAVVPPPATLVTQTDTSSSTTKTTTTATSHSDSMREIRAMVVAALPFPPLPVMASRELEGEASCTEQACCSSHDLIAHLMNIACTVATEEQNRRRAEVQAKIHADLFSAIDAWQSQPQDKEGDPLFLPPAEWSYRLMCDFSRRYIQSYMPDPEKTQDVRFLPLRDIDRAHMVHRKALEFQKAQDVLYGKCKMLTVGRRGKQYVRSYENVSYAELVQMSVARVLDSEDVDPSSDSSLG